MLQATEAYQLIAALVLAPIIIRSLRRIRLPGKRPIVVGLAAMALAYVFTVLEGYYAPEVFNTLEHAMYAASGLAFMASAVEAARYWYRQAGETT
jgi:hypothetical protein